MDGSSSSSHAPAGTPGASGRADRGGPPRRSWLSACRLRAILALVVSLFVCPAAVAAEETITDLAPVSIATNTGEKPQSKVWPHAGTWWAVLPSVDFGDLNDDGTWLWRLEADRSWTNVLQLSTNPDTKADAKAVGDVTHVLLYDGSASELVSIEYDQLSDTYAFWPLRPSSTPVALSGSEIATIDIDSTGRMWLATESGTDVVVYHSDVPYSTFAGPVILASDIDSDDIAVVTAIPNPAGAADTIGVLWSNQNSEQFGFRFHVDGEDPAAWSADEVPAADSFAGGVADDHLNVAVGSDGTLYAAVKTSFDTSGHAKIGLLVRRLATNGPGGTWENRLEVEEVYYVDDAGTRGILLLNEDTATVRVLYTASTGGDGIVYKDSPIPSINFGPKQTLMSGNLNNVTSMKMNWSDEVVVLASDGGSAVGVLIERGASSTTTTTATTTSTTTSTTTTTTTSTTPPTTTTTTTTTTTLVDPGCSMDIECDDGLVCNGAERCISGACQAGAPVNCDDLVGCTLDSCNEPSGCAHVPDDAACDDGVFCNGGESCDAFAGCLAGSDPCAGQPCNETTQTCGISGQGVILSKNADFSTDDRTFLRNETLYMLVFSDAVNFNDIRKKEWELKSGDRVRGQLTNLFDGTYTAAYALDGLPNDNATWNWRGKIEDQARRKFQVTVTITVLPAPACTVDADCDDGLFCTGVERCDPVTDCQAGSDPCPGQSCDEDNGECVDVADAVTIAKAAWKPSREELDVEATSTLQPDAILSVVGFGEMTFIKNRYRLKVRPVPYPGTVTVTSSHGGSDQVAVQIR